MSALVIDTSSWISYFAGRGSSLIDPALSRGDVYLPLVVAAELLSGRLSHKQRAALESLLTDLPVCGQELEHWFRAGKLRSVLRSKGVSVSTVDAHVAQCAIDLHAQLLSEDAIFRTVARYTQLQSDAEP